MLSIYSLLSKRDRDSIVTIATSLAELQKEKTQLQSQIDTTSGFKKDIDAKAQFLAGEVAKVDAYLGQLQTKIAQLTARQQEILAQRLAGLHISRSAAAMGRCDSDLTNGRDPGFSPKLAVFTYGVPNRVGLNQWGAYGRARIGQGYDQILHSYYNFDGYQDFDANMQIRVDGYGSYSLEDYVKRIYEVPADWPSESLKAQAIAARSYVLAYTNKGSGSICASEQCQVFKPDPKGGAWEQAVNDTSGKAMVQGGNPIKAWFSSTHGGYVRTSGEIGWSDTSWTKHATDTSSGNAGSFSDLQNNSYDKDSPWFYCDWGSRSQYNKTAWLTQEEMADIVNAILLGEKDSSTQEHLYQPDNPPSGTDTWSSERVKQELRNRDITPFNSVSGASVSVDWGAGRTTSVSVSGDTNSHTFDGAEFKNFFNLRAPANIQIVGPLYNIEKR
ncbi:SpoIID/LytB domain-containing protein [Candidatus Gottesmanbacteria bacterium]|nr:SpoIID/LytB domain-containing protein [Candidatus Gottesmanbacteria bacterium]